MTVTPKKLFTPATLTNSAATYYTVPASTKTVLKKVSFTNTDTVPRTVTLYLVESGGSAGASNIIISAKAIAPGDTYEAYEVEGHIMNSGDFIRALASQASVVSMHISGVEIV